VSCFSRSNIQSKLEPTLRNITMAEFASAIIGLIQVTENVALQVYRYVKRVKKADQEVRQLSAIVTSLLGIVHGIELAVRELDSHSKDHVLQSEDLLACKNTISQLNLKLSAFVDPIQPGESSLKIHKKWKWPFSVSETKELNLKLEAHKSALSLSLATDNLCAILRLSEAQEVVRSDLQVIQTRLEAQTRIALTKKRESALQRLCALTPLHHHKTNRKLRQPGTGDWFIESSEFQTWLATRNAKLWVYGIPGAGKSILMAYAIEKILSLEDAQSTDSAVAYFYCDYKDSRTQTPQAILSSLAQQIARQDERSFAKLETFVKTHSSDKQSATLSYENEELCELIVDMATNFEKVALVVDGLDECEGFVASVTSYLADLARRSQQIKMLLSSRSLIEISEQVEDYQRISIAARNSDLVLFVGEQIGERMKPKSLHPLRIKDPTLKGEILDTMVRKADGMFRWVALQLDYICGLPTDKSIRDALKSLPPDLFSSYERLIVQLGKKPQSVRDLVQRALRWVLSADLYDSAKAICEAVSIEPDMHRYDATAVPDKLEILRHCGSFIRESFDGHHLESAHFTVKEFFSAIDIAKKPELTPYRLDDRDARRYFAETTLTYLCLDDFEDNHSCTTLQRVREDGMSFRQIAVEKWFFWSRDFLGDRAIMRLVKKLFSQTDRRNLRMWGVNFFTYWRSLALQPEPLMNLVAQTVDCLSPLHYAAMLDMPELCQWLIEQGCSTTSLSPIGSPLHCAILGPMSTVFWTQETECSSLNAEAFREILSRFYGEVKESFLYRNLHNLKQSLQILVSSGANVNEGRAFAGQTDTPPNLLDLAAYTADLICHGDHSEEWLDVTASLVDAGATFKETDSLGVLLSVLDRGLKDGRKYPSIGDLLRKLTKHNLKNHECESLETFLRRWREREPHAYFADQSTQPVGITLTGTDDSSILWFEAAKYDYVDVVARFLSSEAQDVNILNEDGFSALHLAAMRSSIEVVRRLVEHGADINKASNTGSTPLLEALATADKNLIGYLLANSADYTSKDYEDRNIWHFASENESIDALLELSSLPQSVRGLVDLKDSSGQTPLSNAARTGHPEAFFLLLDFQVDEWVTDNRGRTLLHFAAMGGSIKLIEFLINRGHSVLDQDEDGYNALLHAASGTDQDLSRMQCLRALYEANSTCALAKTNDGFSVEDLILDNVIFSLEDENALDNWNEVQAIFMRESRPSIEKLVLRIQEMHEASASKEELGKPWSNLTRIFKPLLQDYFDDISALLGSVLTTLLTIYVRTYEVFVDVESLVDLLCSIIDAMTSTQLETLRVNKRRVLNLVLSSGEPRLISCLVGKNLNVDARDEDVLSQNAIQLACLHRCDLTSFESILGSSKNLAIKTMDGNGLLHLASTTSTVAKVDRLIKAGLEVNALSTSGETPLHYATISNQPSVVRFLLSHGGDPSRKNNRGWVPVQYAAMYGHFEILQQLSAQKVGLNQTCEIEFEMPFVKQVFTARGVSVVHLAAAYGHLECLRHLLDIPETFSIDGTADQSFSPLLCAVWCGQHHVVQYLLALGACTTTSLPGLSPLHLAALNGHVDTVSVLLSCGSDIEATDGQGLTAFAYAMMAGHMAVVATIRGHNEKRQLARTARLNDALGFAIDRHDLEQCKQLIMDGASLFEQCSRETQLTPFLHALYKEDLPIASYFLEKGSSCNGITPDHLPTHSYTALHYCTVLGDKNLLNAILDSCPALIFVATDIHPVHLAIILRRNEILRIMLDRSLDCWQKASSSGMLSLCANGDADVGRQPVESRHLPTKTRKMGILENPSLTEVRVQLRSTTWLASGSDGNLQRYQGFSPMLCAVKASNIEALRLLSSYGALVDSLSSELKTTPLGEAVYICHDEIVSYLLDDGASVRGYNEGCTSIVEEIAIRAENALFERVSPSISHAWHMDITDRNMVSRFATATYPDALIRLGADAESLTTPDMYGQSALIHCFKYGSASVFSYILNSGLDLSGSTPTFGSAVNHSWRDVGRYVLQRLLRRLGRQTSTALLNKKPQYRHTPLYDAAARDQCRILELLLAYEVDLDMVGGPLGSALMAAATYGRLEAVEVLVDAGAAISYFSVEDATTKSAFVQAMHFPRIQRWLLVNRFLRKKWLAWQ
jgi:ankyrin repeat protein